MATNNGILKGVVIAVSKKLLHRQTEIHNLASLLGADCRYIYDESCTHLIHQVYLFFHLFILSFTYISVMLKKSLIDGNQRFRLLDKWKVPFNILHD